MFPLMLVRGKFPRKGPRSRRSCAVLPLKRNAMRGNLAALEFLLKVEGQHPDQEQATDSSINITINGGDEHAD